MLLLINTRPDFHSNYRLCTIKIVIMSAQTPEFSRISAIQDILDANLNAKSDAKLKLNEDIKQLFESSAVCMQMKEQIKNVDYNPKDLRVLKASIKSLESAHSAVQNAEEKEIEALAKKYPVDAAELGAKQEALKVRLAELLTLEHKQLAEVSGKQAVKNALEATLTETKQAYDKQAKTKYSVWKKAGTLVFDTKKKQLKEQLKAQPKESPERARLDAEISTLNVFEYLRSTTSGEDEAYFRLRLARDEISHKSIRSSKTKLTARDLLKRAVKRFSGAAYDSFQRRVNQVTRANLDREEDEKIPDVVLASDFVGCSLSAQGVSPFDMLFQTDMFTQLCVESTHQATCDKLAEQSAGYADQSGMYLAWVTAYLKATYNNGFDASSVAILSNLLVDLTIRYAKCLQSALKYHSNLQTINVGLIHSLYEVLFIMRGVDYEETRTRVDSLWANKQKA